MSHATMTLAAFCARHKITATSVYLGETSEAVWPCHNWTVTIRHGRKRMTTPFFTGRPLAEGPSVDDVLGCLLSEASSVDAAGGIFSQWCSDFGYSDDPRSAHDTWLACCRTLPRLRAFLGDLYDSAQSAEH